MLQGNNDFIPPVDEFKEVWNVCDLSSSTFVDQYTRIFSGADSVMSVEQACFAFVLSQTCVNCEHVE